MLEVSKVIKLYNIILYFYSDIFDISNHKSFSSLLNARVVDIKLPPMIGFYTEGNFDC